MSKCYFSPTTILSIFLIWSCFRTKLDDSHTTWLVAWVTDAWLAWAWSATQTQLPRVSARATGRVWFGLRCTRTCRRGHLHAGVQSGVVEQSMHVQSLVGEEQATNYRGRARDIYWCHMIPMNFVKKPIEKHYDILLYSVDNPISLVVMTPVTLFIKLTLIWKLLYFRDLNLYKSLDNNLAQLTDTIKLTSS